MRKNPLVSVAMITYNQEKYIKQAIDSVLEQQVDFDYEIIIGDDSSTDSTPDILKEYSKKYNNIKVINRRRNIGAIPNFMQTFRQARGKYIALCEGDDFWTDPTKLQRQVDFLEENKDHALVFHPVKVFFENGKIEDSVFPDYKIGFSEEALLKGNFIQTNSVMYRARKSSEYTNLPEDIIPGDWYLHLFHARFGKIGFIDKVMAAYRRHDGGIWWGDEGGNHGDSFWKKNAEKHILMFVKLLDMHGNKVGYQNIVMRNILEIIHLTEMNKDIDRINIIKNIFSKHPGIVENLLHQLIRSHGEIDSLLQEKEGMKRKLNKIKIEKDNLTNKINQINSSWVWRIRNKVAKYLGKKVV